MDLIQQPEQSAVLYDLVHLQKQLLYSPRGMKQQSYGHEQLIS